MTNLSFSRLVVSIGNKKPSSVGMRVTLAAIVAGATCPPHLPGAYTVA
jgi:hypothetical protein